MGLTDPDCGRRGTEAATNEGKKSRLEGKGDEQRATCTYVWRGEEEAEDGELWLPHV